MFFINDKYKPLLKWMLGIAALLALGVVLLAGYALFVLAPGLPALDAVTGPRCRCASTRRITC
jgi:hypothetical protein